MRLSEVSTPGSDLVGREPQQRVLADAVDRVALGSGAVVLIIGEAGIGKTTLAQYGLARAQSRGFTVLQGRTQPQDQALAYAPVTEAFGRHLRSRAAAERARLTRGLPVLGRLVSGLELPPVEPLPDPRWEKARLYEALLVLTGRICADAPVALLVDDLHWADPGTLEALGFLVRDLPGLPVLLILTYRPGAPESVPGFAGLVQSVRRSDAARDVALTRLCRDDVVVLLRRLLRGEPGKDVVDLVSERSGGIPLFVAAFGHRLVERGRIVARAGVWKLVEGAAQDVPPAVRDVLLAEVGQLPGDHRAIVDLVAVGGGRADLSLIKAVAAEYAPDLDTDRLIAELVHSGRLIEEVDGGTVRSTFPHPLVREVAYEAVPGHRRRRLHALVAKELSRRGDVVGQATHCLAAGPEVDPGVRAEVLVVAGRAALDRYAIADARRFFQAASDAAEGVRPDLVETALLGLGDALEWANQTREAVRTWRRALHHPYGPRDPRRRALLYRYIVDVESQRGDMTAAERDAETGLRELAEAPPCEEQLDLLFSLQAVFHRSADLDGVQRVRQRLEDTARQLDIQRARTLRHWSRLTWAFERADYAEATAQLAVLGDPESLEDRVMVIGCRALIAAALGDLAALREANREYAAMERELGTHAGTHRTALFRFVEAFYSGEWDRAAEAFDPLIGDERIDNPRMVALAVMLKPLLAAYQGDFETADRWLREGQSRLGLGQVPEAYGRLILNLIGALVALERGDVPVALDLIERNGERFLPFNFPPWGLVALAEARAKSGRVAAAREAIGRLAALGADGSYPAVMAARLEGLALAADGQAAPAAAMLLGAREGFLRLGIPFEAARAGIEAGEVVVDAGPMETEPVATAVAAAHQTVSRLGAARYVGRAARALRTCGAPVPRPEPSQRESLTTRQWEIASLVAQGMSNAEIAERLFLSVRTVTSHLDHIYTRLGINSRAALASYVTETKANAKG